MKKEHDFKESRIYKIWSFFYQLKSINIKVPYYFVPACPNCGSYVTGRFVERNNNIVYEEKNSLKHGEIIAPVANVGINNCFCIECSTRFKYDVKIKFITPSELEFEKGRRRVNLIYKSKFGKFMEDDDIDGVSEKKNKKNKKHFFRK